MDRKKLKTRFERGIERIAAYAFPFAFLVTIAAMSKGLVEQNIIEQQTLNTTFSLLVSIYFLVIVFDVIILGKTNIAFNTFYEDFLQEDHETLKKIGNPLIRIHKRIFDYISEVKKRSNLALFVGLVLGLIPVLLIFNTKQEQLNTYFLINRGLLVVTLESMAFYFLNLYKSSLENIKYYQNELSNMDLKMFAILNAVQNENNQALEKIAEKFMEEERNFLFEQKTNTKSSHPSDSIENLHKALDKLISIVKNPIQKPKP